ncbi:37S ribosomal protein S10 [Yarrowia sp. B02]|nr:37S ribosomal protein S10 [Yarrowia sp. B02]
MIPLRTLAPRTLPRTALVRFNSTFRQNELGKMSQASVEAQLTPKAQALRQQLSDDLLVPKAGTYTQTEHKIYEANGERPLPISALANYYGPLKVKLPEGTPKVKCAELMFNAYFHEDLEVFTEFAQRAAYYLRIPVEGPMPQKTRFKRWTVNRAVFVHSSSKENFERRTHGRKLVLNNTSQETIQVLVQFLSQNKLAGVGMKAKLYTHEALPESLELLDAMEVDEVSDAAVEARVQEMLKEFDAEEATQEKLAEEAEQKE